MFRDRQKKRMMHLYIIRLILAIALFTIFFIIYKYHVEGEKNLPFNISKMVVVSTAQTDEVILDGETYKASVLQKNDIYLVVEKNENYKKEDIIKKITLNNFEIKKHTDVGTVKVYRPSMLEEKTYEYTEEYITDNIEYIGSKETNTKGETLQIANQGGIISLGITLEDLGNITYEENENIMSDGTLINRLGLMFQNIEFEISFDITMELDSGNTFKATMTLELPKDDLLQNGVSTTEETELNLVFKRI